MNKMLTTSWHHRNYLENEHDDDQQFNYIWKDKTPEDTTAVMIKLMNLLKT